MVQDEENNFSSTPGQYVKKINEKRQLDKMLPSNLQTELLTKFFGGVVNHNFQPENSENFAGFVGKRPHYTKDDDIYIQESTSDRTNYQLEPSMVSVTGDGVQSALTYDDMLNYIRFNGGDVSKPTRLFEQDYYSWAPPINIDMILNYTDYYWLPQGPAILPVIATRVASVKFDNGGTGTHSFKDVDIDIFPWNFENNGTNISVTNHNLRQYQMVKFETSDTLPTSVASDVEYYVKLIDENNFELGMVQASQAINVSTDIIGQKHYTTPNGISLSSGMHIRFEGLNITPSEYVDSIFIVEGVGANIRLVPREHLFLPTEFESDLPDYIIMERGSADMNPWSRRNNWYHKDQLLLNDDSGEKIQSYGVSAWDTDPWDTLPWGYDESMSAEVHILDSTSQAKRPILCFEHDIELHDSGTSLVSIIDTVDTTTTNIISSIVGKTSYVINNVVLEDGMRILVTNDDSTIMNNKLYDVFFRSGRIALDAVRYNTDVISGDDTANPEIGDKVYVKFGLLSGLSYYWNGTRWADSQHKTANNQPPRFAMYDNDGNSFSDKYTYPVTDFKGSTIFEFKLNKQSGAQIDPVTSLPLTFAGMGQISDIVYENTQRTDIITYKDTSGADTVYTGYKYHKRFNDGNPTYSNSWHVVGDESRQYFVERFKVTDPSVTEFAIKTPVLTDLSHHVFATANGTFIREFSIENNVFKHTLLLAKDTIIELYIYNNKLEVDETHTVTLPRNLTANPLNGEIDTITRADFYNHFGSIIGNQVTLKGNENLTNNFRNTERDMSRGHFILQHNAPLLRTFLLASDPTLDIVKSIRYCSDEYNRFRNKIVIKSTAYHNSQTTDKNITTRDLLDKIIAEINLAKGVNFPFSDSQMIASGNDYIEQISLFGGTHEQVKYTAPDMSVGSASAVLIYANNDLLIKEQDYKIDEFGQLFITSPTIEAGTTITTRTYNNKSFSYIPATPASMGITPSYRPKMISDDTYVTPTDVIVGHDGNRYIISNTLADDIIYELEKRIYNAMDDEIINSVDFVVDFSNIVSNAYHERDYTRGEYTNIYSKTLHLWASQNSIKLYENKTYDPTEPKTWNYRNTPVFAGINASGDNMYALNADAPGHWRGLFEYYYGTQHPHISPWEMVGFVEKPDWFDAEYGVAPYCSANEILWQDMEQGVIKFGYNAGTHEKYTRPNLSRILPVDLAGNLLMPVDIGLVVSKPLDDDIAADWVIGDVAPAENTWLNSPSNQFAECTNFYLMKPATFVELGWSTLDYSPARINNNQRISTLSGHRTLKESAKIHGVHGHVKGIQQFVSEFLVSDNKDIQTGFADKIEQLDIRLMHRFGSFVKDNNLVVNSESTVSPNDRESRIPTEDVDLIVYESPSKKELFYSGVIIEKIETGYKIYGYNMVDPVFRIEDSNTLRGSRSVNVGGLSVSYYKEGTGETSKVPYGTEFESVQDVFEFLISYGRQLINDGFVFDTIDENSNEIINWLYTGKQFLFWASEKWTTNSFITLSPAADQLHFVAKTGTVKNIEDIIQGTYSIVDAAGEHIRPDDVSVSRYQDQLIVTPTSGSLYGVRLFMTEIEHAVVFSNVTKFNDLIFNPIIGLRIPRLRITGTRISNWTGRIEADGYLVDPENNVLYPNLEKQTDDFREFRDIDSIGLSEEQSALVGNSIGYNTNTNLLNMSMTTSTQLELHKSVIREKGTLNAATALTRSSLINNGHGVVVDEEWAILASQYGGTGTTNTVAFELKSTDIKTTAQYVNFSDSNTTVLDSKFDDIIDFIDVVEDGVVTAYDPRWVLPKKTANMFNVNKKVSEYTSYVTDTGFPKLSEVTFTALTIDDLVNDRTYTSASERDTVWIAEDIDSNSEWQRGWNVRQLENLHTTARVRDDNSLHLSSTLLLEENDVLLFTSKDSDNIHKKVKYVDMDGDSVETEIVYNIESDDHIITVNGSDRAQLKALEIIIDTEFDGNYPNVPSIELYSADNSFEPVNYVLTGGNNVFDFADITVFDNTDIRLKFNKSLSVLPERAVMFDIRSDVNEYNMPPLYALDNTSVVSVKKDGKLLNALDYVIVDNKLHLANIEYTVDISNAENQMLRFYNDDEIIIFSGESAASIADKINKLSGINATGASNSVIMTTPFVNDIETRSVTILEFTDSVAPIDTIPNQVFEIVDNNPQFFEELTKVDYLEVLSINIDVVLTPENYAVGANVLVIYQEDDTLNGLYNITSTGFVKLLSAETITKTTSFWVESSDKMYTMDVNNHNVYYDISSRTNKYVIDGDNVRVFDVYSNEIGMSSLVESDGLVFVEDIDPVIGSTLYISVELDEESTIQYATQGKATIKLDYSIPKIVAVDTTDDMESEKTYDVYFWKTRRFVNNVTRDNTVTKSSINPVVDQFTELTINNQTVVFDKVSNTLKTSVNPVVKLNSSMTFDVGNTQFTSSFNTVTFNGIETNYSNIPYGSTLTITEMGVNVSHQVLFSLTNITTNLTPKLSELENTAFSVECPIGSYIFDTVLPASITSVNDLHSFLNTEMQSVGNISIQILLHGDTIVFKAASNQSSMRMNHTAASVMELQSEIYNIDNTAFVYGMNNTYYAYTDTPSNIFRDVAVDSDGMATFVAIASPGTTGITFASNVGDLLFDNFAVSPDIIYDDSNIDDIQSAILSAPITTTGELATKRNNRLYINYTSNVVDAEFRGKLSVVGYTGIDTANRIGIPEGDYSTVDLFAVSEAINSTIVVADPEISIELVQTNETLNTTSMYVYNIYGGKLDISNTAAEPLGLSSKRSKRPVGGYTDGDLIFIDDSATYNRRGELLSNNSFANVGTVLRFDNNSFNIERVDNDVTDIGAISKAIVYDSAENVILTDLVLFDPLKGAIPGIADAELYYKTNNDPAKYGNNSWGSSHVGRVWFDLNSAKYIKYEQQDDQEYTRNNWGRLFPGASLRLAEWISSPVKPSDWVSYVNSQDTTIETVGTPLYDDQYVTERMFNLKTQKSENIYYFWVINKRMVPNVTFRHLSLVEIGNILTSPAEYGVNWVAPVGKNSLIITTLAAANKNSVVQLEMTTSTTQNKIHTEWDLIKTTGNTSIDARHWNKMRDSLVGFDDNGLEVPDSTLPSAEQLGHNIRPRQTWFKDVSVARRDWFTNLNNIAKAKDVVDLPNFDLALDALGYIDAPVYAETVITSSNSATISVVNDDSIGETIEINDINVYFTPNVVKTTGKADVGDIFNDVNYVSRLYINGIGVEIPAGAPIGKVVKTINDNTDATDVSALFFTDNDNVFIDFRVNKPSISFEKGSIGNVGSALGISYGDFRNTVVTGNISNPGVDSGDTIVINGVEYVFTDTDIIDTDSIVYALNVGLKHKKSAPIADMTMYTGRRFRIEYEDGTTSELYTFGSSVHDISPLLHTKVFATESNELSFYSDKAFRIVNDLINDDDWEKLDIDSRWLKTYELPYTFYKTPTDSVGIKYNGLVISDFNVGTINDIVGTHTTADMNKIVYDIQTANIANVTARLTSDTRYLEIVNISGASLNIVKRMGTIFDILGFDQQHLSGEYPVTTVADLNSLQFVTNTTTANQTVLVTYDINVDGWSLWQKQGSELVKISNQTVNTTKYWKYIDWFEGATRRENPTRVFANLLEMSATSPAFESELVKILDDGTGKWSMYEAQDGVFVIVGKELRTLEFNIERISNKDAKLEIRKILDAARDVILTNEEERSLFFGMVDSVFAEQNSVDWIFKTSYIHLSGIYDEILQSPVNKHDYIDNYSLFINEVKPYHTKIREISRTKSFQIEDVNTRATDFDKPTSTDDLLVWDDSIATIKTSGELSIAKVAAGPETYENRIRKMKIGMKFDRVSYYGADDESGAASRIRDMYAPELGMVSKENSMNTGFKGTIIDSGPFNMGEGWDSVDWDSVAWDVNDDIAKTFYDDIAIGQPIPSNLIGYSSTYSELSDGVNTVIKLKDYLDTDQGVAVRINETPLVLNTDYVVDDNVIIFLRTILKSTVVVPSLSTELVPADGNDRGFSIDGVYISLDGSLSYTLTDIVTLINDANISRISAEAKWLDTNDYELNIIKTRTSQTSNIIIELLDDTTKESLLNKLGYVAGDYNVTTVGDVIHIIGTFGLVFKTPDLGNAGTYNVLSNGTVLTENKDYIIDGENVNILVTSDENVETRFIGMLPHGTLFITFGESDIKTETRELDAGKYIQPHLEGYPEELIPVKPIDVLNIYMETRTSVLKGTTPVTAIPAGTIIINGIEIVLDGTETLADVVSKINQSNAGVTSGEIRD